MTPIGPESVTIFIHVGSVRSDSVPRKDARNSFTVRVPDETLDWLDSHCGPDQVFASYNHAVNRALLFLRKHMEDTTYESRQTGPHHDPDNLP